MPLTVEAEQARSDMVCDPVPLPPRAVEMHAMRDYILGGKQVPACLTVEVHDPLATGSNRSLLLHFDAEKLMAAIALALVNSDA